MELTTDELKRDCPLTPDDLARLTSDVRDTCEKMAGYILRTADYERGDRLWPADFMVFETNPLNVAYGACGTALFLREALGELPPEVVAWMLRRPLSVETYPPGLYVGLAGVAYTFLGIGLDEKAEEAMELSYQSPLLYEEPGMFLGVAGWGLASLRLFIKTGKQVYVDRAVQAGEHLLRTAQAEGETCYWRCARDDALHYGFGYGASGIALFLLYLHTLTGKDDYRVCAVKGLEFDLANKVEGEVGWQWKRFEGDSIVYPYMIHGSAGIGSVLIRFSQLLGVERYRALACRIAADTYIKYSFVPSLFEGLAGIGEFMLDMFCFTGDEAYRRNAFDIADTILWFKIERPEGTAYPGGWLTRISNDYGTGAAGVGLFFKRLLRPRGRLLLDLDSETDLCSPARIRG